MKGRRIDIPRKWCNRIRMKFHTYISSPHCDDKDNIMFVHSTITSPDHDEDEETIILTGRTAHSPHYEVNALTLTTTTLLSSQKLQVFPREEISAAIKIQASFRGQLARRAYRAPRSLVKLQALVRGVRARRQARIAQHFMHSLVRLQLRVRARQLLITN